MESIVYNCDCMEAMAKLPDGAFDLAIVDPPYGIGKDWMKRKNNRRVPTRAAYKATSYTNDVIPPQHYFDELRRVAKDRIIWGYNYYAHILGSTNYLLVWDKCCGRNDAVMYSKCEIAYTSFRVPCNIVHVPWDGYRMGEETGTKKIHPHQKPVALYDEILHIYIVNPVCASLTPMSAAAAAALPPTRRGLTLWGTKSIRTILKHRSCVSAMRSMARRIRVKTN